jgi:magnesium transporter
MTLTCHLFRDGTIVEEAFDPARISDTLQDEGTLMWLDVVEPSEQDLAMLQEEFDLPPVVIEDVREQEQRPHVEAFGDAYFIVMYAFALQERQAIPQELHAIVGPRYLVTLRYKPAFDMQPVLRRWKQEEPGLAKEGGGFLLHPLLDEVVDSYLEVLDELELRSEEVEEEVFGESPAADIQATIFREKKRLLEFRRRVLPLREVIDLLQEEHQVVTPALRAEYKDVADHVVRSLELVESVRELLTTALDAHLSRVGHQLNEIMKKLTSWAAIILVPTLIAGIYGMNFFRPFPDFAHPVGFWIAIGMMLVSGGSLYWVFRRRGWM